MKAPFSRNRVLNPLERFSEIAFGLTMVLSFTCAISVAESGREAVRTMFIGAITCNIAWGIIDAAFYLIACLTEKGHNIVLLRDVQQARDPSVGRRIISDTMLPKVAAILEPADFDRIQSQLKQLPIPPAHPGLTGRDWLGAIGVFLLVFISTFPVVAPFILMKDARLALYVSNAIAIVLLFGAGQMLARYAGLRPLLTGIVMVAVGAAFVALTIALGG